MLARFREFASRLFAGHASTAGLQVVPGGFVLSSDGQVLDQVVWDEVREIVAYRYNGPRLDMIALMFHLPGDAHTVQINEEAEGWSQVTDAMLRAFPSLSRDWHFDVRPTTPPFPYPEFKVLFRRD